MADGTSTNLSIDADRALFDGSQALDTIVSAIKHEIEQMLGVQKSNQELYAVEADSMSGCFNLVLSLVDNGVLSVIEAESWSRHFCSDYNARRIKNDETIIGDSKHYPMLGSRACSTGVHTWVLRAEGNTDSMWFGVARPTVNLETRPANKFYRNQACWGFSLTDRLMCFAGERVRRAGGADVNLISREQPCEAMLKLDCSAGTLSVAVGEVDLGVICSTLPVSEPLHLAVTTYHPKAKLTLLSYTSSARQVLMGTTSW
jgi:hypothetical protein